MILSKQKQDQLRADAQTHAKIEPAFNSPCEITRKQLNEWAENDYWAGAYTEAVKAASLVKALEGIKDMIQRDYLNNGNNQLATNINMEIGIALANYNKQPQHA